MKNDVDHHGETANNPAVCEQVLENWKNLLSSLTWDEFTFATVRPDPDSVTAMAVLKSQIENREIDKDFVRAVAILDIKWPQWLKSEYKDNLEIQKLTNALNYISFDFKIPLVQRVELTQQILDGSIDMELVEKFREIRQKELWEAKSSANVVEVVPGKLVFIESDHRMVMTLGYEHANTVVAFNPSMPVMENKDWKFVPTWEKYKKYTIAKNTEQIPTDIDTILKEISELEKWRGGRWTIIWSPQNVSSNLTPEQVIDVVKKYVK
jgi:anaerobic selenocysteine-containing dehydrogenase